MVRGELEKHPGGMQFLHHLVKMIRGELEKHPGGMQFLHHLVKHLKDAEMVAESGQVVDLENQIILHPVMAVEDMQEE